MHKCSTVQSFLAQTVISGVCLEFVVIKNDNRNTVMTELKNWTDNSLTP